MVPAERSVSQPHRIFHRVHTAGEVLQSFTQVIASRLRDQVDELRAEQLLLRRVPESAIRVVDEGQRRIRQEPAYELILGIDHAPVPLLALPRFPFGETAS